MAKGVLMTRTITGCKPTADINPFIVRSSRSDPNGFTLIKGLSPSPALFKKYLDWKKDGQWPKKWLDYKADFLLEMELPTMKFLLDLIQARLDEGKSVQLVCFCPDMTYCHRSLIADYFERLGYVVDRG